MAKDKKVDEYINSQEATQKEICLKVREIFFDTFPKIKEEMKWGVPAYGGGIYYMVALKDHINVGFSLKGLSKEETALLEGSGKTMKHIKVDSLEGIDKSKIVRFLEMVSEHQAVEVS